MGWFDRLRRFRRAVPEPTHVCSYCVVPEEVELVELGCVEEMRIFLFRCPECGQYWLGYVFAPHCRWALTPEEAADCFPDAFRPVDEQGG